MSKPSTNGSDGRDNKSGRFAKGWKGGPGNPHAKKIAGYRAALIEAVTPADIKAAIRSLVKAAKEGDVIAIRELLDRTVGKPTPILDHEAAGLSMPIKIIVVQGEAE